MGREGQKTALEPQPELFPFRHSSTLSTPYFLLPLLIPPHVLLPLLLLLLFLQLLLL